MSSCSDQIVGRMLHAYELGMLEEDEEQRFEIHLITCSFCQSQLARSSDLVKAMKGEQINTSETGLASDEVADGARSWLARNYVSVTAVLAVLCLVLTYPAFHWLAASGDGSGHVVPIDRRLTLLQNRSDSDNSSFNRTERIIIVAGWAGVMVGQDYDLTITRVESGDLVFHGHTTRFNESGLVELLIEPSTFPAGNYVVRIRNSDGSGDWDDLTFQCK